MFRFQEHVRFIPLCCFTEYEFIELGGWKNTSGRAKNHMKISLNICILLSIAIAYIANVYTSTLNTSLIMASGLYS